MKKQLACALTMLGVSTLAYADGGQCPSKGTCQKTPERQVASDADETPCTCPRHHRHHRRAPRAFFADPFFDASSDIFAETLQAIEQAQVGINAIMDERHRDAVDKQITIDIKDEDPAVLKVMITFAKPSEFSEKDIAVTIASNDMDDTKTLKVTAKKTAEKSDDKDNKKDDKEKTISHHMASSYSYAQSSVNGRVNKRASGYSCSDGVFNWSMVLPADVITDGDYVMSFKDGQLVITLNRKADMQQVRALEFTKEEDK